MPTHTMPGRSLVTRRALVDMIRAATLGSYGVTGFAASPLERLLGRIGLRQPGIHLRLDDGMDIELDLTVAYGVPIAEVARQVDSAVRYSLRRALAREVEPAHHPCRRAAVQPGDGAALGGAGQSGRGRTARPRGQRHGRRLMARRACDGPGLLEAFRAAVANLEAHVDEINALNVYPVPDGDTGSNMLATVRAALEEADLVGRPDGRPDRGGDQLRRADGRPRQLGRHHQPDLPGHGRSARRQGTVQRARPRARPVRGSSDRLRRGRQAGRRHDPDRHPRVRGGSGDRRGARSRHRVRPRRDGRGGRALGRPDAQPAGHPARGGRGRLGRPGPVPAAPGGAPPCREAVARGRGEGPGTSRAGRQGVDPRRPRRRGLRLRDDVPAPAEPPRCARRGRHPRPPRVDRRFRPRGRRRAGAQGPRPQRPAGPGHRLRADDGHA